MTKIVKAKKPATLETVSMTLDVIYNAIVGLDSRVSKLESRFDKVDDDIKELRNYIDDEISSLAGMVQRGFQEQARMFGMRMSNRHAVA
jgi:uncharacterized protein YoxC